MKPTGRYSSPGVGAPAPSTMEPGCCVLRISVPPAIMGVFVKMDPGWAGQTGCLDIGGRGAFDRRLSGLGVLK